MSIRIQIKTIILLTTLAFNVNATEVIRINQLGYLPQSTKVAVFLSSENKQVSAFTVHNAITDEIVYTGKTQIKNAENWGMKTVFRLDFSALENEGGYYIKVGKTHSLNFRINTGVYDGTAEFLLNYLRQQRCGYNPYLNDSCHTHDGIIVDHPTKTGQIINVPGGWHDATDYLQYSTTSVNTVFQMMFAWQNFPEIYGDNFDKNGEPGSNGIADILDEIRWGLDWMLKMNPTPGEMYNQIADDRDHIGFRLPVGDKADYGLGEYRPVYFVTGKPQGLAKYKNQSTGVSSIAGKFASGFAFGAQLFEKSEPGFSEMLKQKAMEAWQFALSDTGFCQTACNVSPYFYEERNYADDLELAATQLYKITKEQNYLKEAAFWGSQERVSPWIKNGKARHYESYPFINLGHHFLVQQNKKEFSESYSEGLKTLFERGKNDPFFYGLPFLWCSNNLVAAAITQAHLYKKETGDIRFEEMEAALRDWLFGCNPWGTAMICGLPEVDDSPMFPHSSYTVLFNETTPGGLVDGPVYDSIYNNQIGIVLTRKDEYAPFNKGKAVYHDDIGDYSTNEPTMDGTASLSYYLAALEQEGKSRKIQQFEVVKDDCGAMIQLNPNEKNIYLAFTADSLFEGGRHIVDILRKYNIRGSFFFTGNFLRLQNQNKIITEIIGQNHYVGAHSDKHLLYCDWEKRDSTLVSYSTFETDLKANFAELKKFGIGPADAPFFMPPYEWYNQEIVKWSHKLGFDVINFSPETGTNADYTTPEMKNYKSSEQLITNLRQLEVKNRNGLNGSILLIHPGTENRRTDKLYFRLEEIIDYYISKGYQFKSLKPENG